MSPCVPGIFAGPVYAITTSRIVIVFWDKRLFWWLSSNYFQARAKIVQRNVMVPDQSQHPKIKLCDWPNKLDATSWQVLNTTESVGMDRF